MACFVLATTLGLPSEAAAQLPFQESFETDGQGSRYTASTPNNKTANDHWNRTDGSNIANESSAGGASNSYTLQDGTYFWAAEDVDHVAFLETPGTNGNGADEQSLDITGINIAGYTGLMRAVSSRRTVCSHRAISTPTITSRCSTKIVMVARQLGYRLPAQVTNGLWQWAQRGRENQSFKTSSG